MKPRRISAAEVVANHVGWDIAEVKEHRYQPGQYSCPVFTIGKSYFATGRSKPAYLFGECELDWKRIPNSFPGMPDLWEAPE